MKVKQCCHGTTAIQSNSEESSFLKDRKDDGLIHKRQRKSDGLFRDMTTNFYHKYIDVNDESSKT